MLIFLLLFLLFSNLVYWGFVAAEASTNYSSYIFKRFFWFFVFKVSYVWKAILFQKVTLFPSKEHYIVVIFTKQAAQDYSVQHKYLWDSKRQKLFHGLYKYCFCVCCFFQLLSVHKYVYTYTLLYVYFCSKKFQHFLQTIKKNS